MKPTVTTMLQQLSSFLKTDAPSGRATGTPFAHWDHSRFDSWTRPPARSAVAGHREAVRSGLKTRARQAYAMYYM
ncbi:MAG: hypothetical protein WCO00_15580 [Rhodospirillaceae bacterium]